MFIYRLYDKIYHTFQSFTTLVNNALRVAAINSVGDFILFLGKIGVMAATGAVGILWFKVSLTLLILMDFPVQIATIRMELSIIYFLRGHR